MIWNVVRHTPPIEELCPSMAPIYKIYINTLCNSRNQKFTLFIDSYIVSSILQINFHIESSKSCTFNVAGLLFSLGCFRTPKSAREQDTFLTQKCESYRFHLRYMIHLYDHVINKSLEVLIEICTLIKELLCVPLCCIVV